MSLIGIDLGQQLHQGRGVRRRRDGPRRAPVETCRGTDPSPATGRWTSANRGRRSGRPSPPSPPTRRSRRTRPSRSRSAPPGREVFPVAADGTPLGPCLMTADIRGDDVAAETAALHSPEEWFRLTGHMPRRMDPVNRALWWRRERPRRHGADALVHELARVLRAPAQRPAGGRLERRRARGRPTTSRRAAGPRSGSPRPGIDPAWLPEVQPNATPIGRDPARGRGRDGPAARRPSSSPAPTTPTPPRSAPPPWTPA